MGSGYKRSVIAAAALIAGFGALRTSQAATLIEDDQSAQVDGWNITAPTGVSLTVTSSGDEISIEKLANFTVPNQGFQIGFQPVAGAGSPATLVDFTDESVQNNTGSAFSGFQFILMNAGSANATFDGLGNVFAPPTGTGVDFTSVSLNTTKDILTYGGTQAAGSTSSWGSANPGDDLLIDAPSGAVFSVKELSSSGGGGGGGSVVPLPSAAWQSLFGLLSLGLIGIGRQLKNRQSA
jgi:hypothetical protein